MPRPRRKKKLIQPGFQLRLIGKLVGLSVLALVLQFLLLGYLLSDAVHGLEEGAGQLADQVPLLVLKTLGLSFVLLLPVLFGFGVLLTFQIAGPVYRFESYLRALARGEQREPCSIREGDELQSLCDAINEVSAHVGVHTEVGVEPSTADETRLRRVS